MLDAKHTALVLVDVQGRLARAMHDSDALIARLQCLIKGAQALSLPIVWVEQYPEGLGPTVPELAELLGQQSPIAKLSFGCGASAEVMAEIERLGCRQLLLCGIESHVCVYQSAAQWLAQGFEVQVVADAVSARTPANHQLGLQRMAALGAKGTGVEMALFELMGRCDHPEFKTLLKLVK
ncbi:hydrolase [Ferrimonas balearica]|uniref:hydrolase n=1 Tax=Ferrimonas balearica TaxID=44012 RepID=UPI001C95B94A|nr:hydrolase [Ferrimonas balearica]MBY6226231.1 hydrolase [Ferrimonas balearica]